MERFNFQAIEKNGKKNLVKLIYTEGEEVLLSRNVSISFAEFIWDTLETILLVM